MGDILERYFSYLMLRKNDELHTKPLPAISRKMTNFMKEYYKIIDSENSIETKKIETQ